MRRRREKEPRSQVIRALLGVDVVFLGGMGADRLVFGEGAAAEMVFASSGVGAMLRLSAVNIRKSAAIILDVSEDVGIVEG